MLAAALKRLYQPLAIGFIASSMILGAQVAAAADTLTGAGGTAIYPVLSKWAASYKKDTGTEVNYQSIGSGGGIKQIQSKTVAFANSDKPLTPDELNKSNLAQFPAVIIRHYTSGQFAWRKTRRDGTEWHRSGRYLPGQDHQLE